MIGWAAAAAFKNQLLGWEAFMGFPPYFYVGDGVWKKYCFKSH